MVKEYVGGYSDWQRTVMARTQLEPERRGGARRPPLASRKGKEPAKSRRLSYLEKKEWESLPGRIEELEKELEDLHEKMAHPDFFRGDPDSIRTATARSQALPEEIEAAFQRWAELDDQASG